MELSLTAAQIEALDRARGEMSAEDWMLQLLEQRLKQANIGAALTSLREMSLAETNTAVAATAAVKVKA